MNFAIISAGNGERLKEEGINLPKPLVRINNIPMLERLFKIINDHNAVSINIIVNEEAKEVHDFIKNHALRNKINLKIKSTISSLHSLYELQNFLKDKPFCLLTVDSIFLEPEFSRFIKFINTNNQSFDASLGITPFIRDEKPLHVELDSNNFITRFSDELNSSPYVTGGIYYFKKNIYDEINFAVNNNYKRLRNFLKLLIEKKYLINGFTFTKIVDVDHIDDIKTAEAFLSEEINIL